MGVKRVLIIDDSRVSRLMTRSIVAKLLPDAEVFEAADGAEGIAAAAERPCDFMLVDVNMPGMDGFECSGILRRAHPGAVISLLTANIQDTTRQKAEALGVGFIAKPVKEEKLAGFFGLEVAHP